MKRKMGGHVKSVFMVLLLLIGAFSAIARNPVSATQDGDYTYSVYDGRATITGYTGAGGAITLPSTLGGYPVFAIVGGGPFYSSAITSINIPNNITSIGNHALYGLFNLTAINVNLGNPNYSSIDGVLYDKALTTLIQCPCGKTSVVTIPNNVTYIGDLALAYCAHLTSVSIPNSVASIGNNAFFYCASLTSVSMGVNVTSIGESGFAYCYNLTTVNIGISVPSIGYAAFSWCTSLSSVTIPNSVTSIGNIAFAGCTNLTAIIFSGPVKPTVGENWIQGTPSGIRGHALAASNFPAPGGVFNGLMMGEVITSQSINPTGDSTMLVLVALIAIALVLVAILLFMWKKK